MIIELPVGTRFILKQNETKTECIIENGDDIYSPCDDCIFMNYIEMCEMFSCVKNDRKDKIGVFFREVRNENNEIRRNGIRRKIAVDKKPSK